VSAKSLLQDLLSELAICTKRSRMLSDNIIRNEIVRDLGGTPGTPAPQFPPAGLQSVKAYRDASERDSKHCSKRCRTSADSTSRCAHSAKR